MTKEPTKNHTKVLPKRPIYPPNKRKAELYWLLSFSLFLASAFYGQLLVVLLSGVVLASTSAMLGEQLYKENVYKEILYYRALGALVSIDSDEHE